MAFSWEDWRSERLVRLVVLDYGLFRVHSNGRVIGIQGYLLTTASERHILVDTGFPRAYSEDASGSAARDGLGSFGEVLVLTEDNLPEGQLARLGLTPEDVSLHILTHGDIDHVGGLDRFAHVPVLVGRAERAMPRPRYFGDVQPLGWPDAEYVPVDEDTRLCEGVTILSTPGHSPGHLSLALSLPNTGPVVVTADAISRPSEPEEGMRGSWDEQVALMHARRLERMAHEKRALLIYGHCPVQWPKLRKAPEAYD